MPRLQSIHLAKATRLPMRALDSAEVEAGKGIVGDRYHGTKHRHVTVQSAESLAQAARAYGAEVPAELTRRNLTVDAGVVPREPGTRITVGPVVLEVVRVAAPCKLLDDTIGRGAQEALRRRAGSVCRVLVGGTIHVGDDVALGRLDSLPAGTSTASGSGSILGPMREAFAHDAVLEMSEGADERAPGGAVTVALCGALDHEPPCPVAPHHTSVTGRGRRRRVRVLFATDDEPVVRRTIDAALGCGEFVGPDGTTNRWVLRSSTPGTVTDAERGHAARLIES